MKEIIIDVGGTNIDVYTTDELDYFSLTKKIKTPNSYLELKVEIKKIVNNLKPSIISLGLPGPVNTNHFDNVFCPPLNFDVYFADIYKIDPSIHIKIMNDLAALSILLKNSKNDLLCQIGKIIKTRPEILMTLGTSFGFAYLNFNNSGNNHSCKSLEIAHQRIIFNDYFFRKIQENIFLHQLYKFKYKDLLSGEGFQWTKKNFNNLIKANFKIFSIDEFQGSFEHLYIYLMCEIISPLIKMSSPNNLCLLLHGGVVKAINIEHQYIFKHVFERENIESLRIVKSK